MGSIASHDGFIDLVDRHRGILFKVAGAYCRNPSDREDLIAEIIVALWRGYDRFDGRSSFATWTYRVAVNVAIAFFRRDARRRRDLVPVEESVLAAVAAPAEGVRDERLDFLRELIDRLEPLDRALMLLYLDDYPHGEIAAILGISESNVGTKIGRIKERFRRAAAERQL